MRKTAGDWERSVEDACAPPLTVRDTGADAPCPCPLLLLLLLPHTDPPLVLAPPPPLVLTPLALLELAE